MTDAPAWKRALHAVFRVVQVGMGAVATLLILLAFANGANVIIFMGVALLSIIALLGALFIEFIAVRPLGGSA